MRWMVCVFTTLLILAGCSSLGSLGIGFDFKFTEGKAPTYEEARRWREAQEWTYLGQGKWTHLATRVAQGEKEATVINGVPVDRKEWSSVVNIFTNNSACTATVIGPRTIITAGHCQDTGKFVQFRTVTGETYKAEMTVWHDWPRIDFDVNLGFTDRVITGVKYMFVDLEHREEMQELVTILGYGCINPGGTGGNDGVLRKADAPVTGADGFDLRTGGSSKVAGLCSGDSGGPVVKNQKLIGINSKGNLCRGSTCENWTARLTWPKKHRDAGMPHEAKNFFADWANANGAAICGFNSTCGTAPNPPEEQPKKYKFEIPERNVTIEASFL